MCRASRHDGDGPGERRALASRGRERAETHRQCALTRERRPVAELIRFVLDPGGNVVADLRCRLPGRGVWLSCARNVVAAAVTRKVFSRALRTRANADDALPDRVADLLARAALADLGLANKAGLLVLGYAKIAALSGRGGVVALVHACDASADGARKLARAFSGGQDDTRRDMQTVTSFEVEQLSLALGRPNVVHAALIEGGASRKFLMSAARSEAYLACDAALAVNPDRGVGEV